MHVELNVSQRDLLLHLVDVAAREIGPEIRHTDSSRFRDDLRAQRAELRELHTLLSVAQEGRANDARGLVGTP